MRLPRLNITVPIAAQTGFPTTMFARFWETFCATLEAIFARQDATDVSLQAQIDRLTAFLNGTGEDITSAGAFANSVVPTRVVQANAITNEAASFTAATVDVSTTETTVQTVSYTTTGETLEVRANFYLSVLHEAGGGVTARIRLYRDAVPIFDQTFAAIDDDILLGWQTPIVIEAPAAGTYTFTATVQTSVNTFDFARASARLLSVREFKR